MRLVDARVLFEDIKEYMVDPDLAISDHRDDIYHYNSGLLTAMRSVLEAPTVDLVKHGQWIKTGQSFLFPEGFRNYSCSVCGYDIDKIKYRYCPNCGAKMDGEKDETD